MRLDSSSGWLLQVPNEHLLQDNNFNLSRIILLLKKEFQDEHNNLQNLFLMSGSS